MSAVDDGRNGLAGLTLDAILGNAKRPEPPPTQNRTLLDIIREDGPTKDKKSWKTFRDKLRLKRAGAAWTSSVHIPASDVNVHGNRSHLSRRASFASNSADSTRVEDGGERAPVSDPTVVNSRLQLARRSSVRFGNNLFQTDHDDSTDVSMPSDAPPSRSFRPQIARHCSTRFPSSNAASYDDDNSSDDNSPEARDGTHRLGAALAEERALSAREAVAAQEAAEAAAAAAAAEQAAAENEVPAVAAEEPVRMSLMDLLEETGSRYTMGEDDDDYDEEEEDDEEEVAEASGGIEYTCCVCMVRHKGAAFIPCGHTFCRLCSRELWVQRGNCPLCNGFILEILDIF
ncbi:uncharacterized protein LOC110408938 [Herrania umbratica]|uniref:Uncharacterized protein LOC110408938 n=1 Tax=Herrania umbratica TaxID=108875 RepID=A0A6J0ZGG3_9ROSI|nr:uncharacterized protein LOC110408938 [Herrania umbratica]XP_021273772.1 uncharacterized protein LOC110408938 [Herrania umbratica]